MTALDAVFSNNQRELHRRFVTTVLAPQSVLTNLTGCHVNVPAKEIANVFRNHIAVFFKCKVASVEQVEFKILQISLVRMGSIGREDVIVPAPDDQRRRLSLVRDCFLVGQLHFAGARAQRSLPSVPAASILIQLRQPFRHFGNYKHKVIAPVDRDASGHQCVVVSVGVICS